MPTQVNPATGEEGKSFPELSDDQIESKLATAAATFRHWRDSAHETRTDLLIKIADEFARQKEALAAIITSEMGKPVKQARTEIDKCEKAFRFYAENGPPMLDPVERQLVSGRSVSRWLPQGPVRLDRS